MIFAKVLSSQQSKCCQDNILTVVETIVGLREVYNKRITLQKGSDGNNEKPCCALSCRLSVGS